jgi:hypothetical protein
MPAIATGTTPIFQAEYGQYGKTEKEKLGMYIASKSSEKRMQPPTATRP